VSVVFSVPNAPSHVLLFSSSCYQLVLQLGYAVKSLWLLAGNGVILIPECIHIRLQLFTFSQYC